ncbi:hypothetical protein [Dictyobacter formicarum]|uniref:Cardiolipin synthase N-terminal domain-containing protein n=1 Tax=Dictyobacter formicarum TaxID=2778368 RepID=A0ABQ3VDR3_9CHLR|nr:hypothetical protein [Dictyobacter formicarum]GHO84272.1 hypothetical protein KSZ_22780 [Dictyobacter formicarum]
MSFLANPLTVIMLWIVVIILFALFIVIRIARTPQERRGQITLEIIPTVLGFVVLMVLILFFPGIFAYVRGLIVHKP